MATPRTTRLKKFGYLAFLTTPALPFIGLWLGNLTGKADLCAWFTVAYIYLVIPVADLMVGLDQANPAPTAIDGSDYWYKALLALCPPLVVTTLLLGAWVFVHSGFSLAGQLGWAVSVGLVSGALAINAAHELIHKRSRLERTTGGLLLSLVCYGGFKVEHLRGHHVNVSTPADASTARVGQSVYAFVPRAWLLNFINAWRLEARRLARLGLPVLHWRNELLWWYATSSAIALAFYAWLGAGAVAFFALQSLAAVTFLEIVNYLEHYGLRRRRLENGRYERTTHQHSWNSNYLLTNLLLFQLQRHSDHHANPTRPYQLLRHYDDSPQLPAGYATMMLLTLVPPLWRRVMDPRVDAYYGAGDGHAPRAAVTADRRRSQPRRTPPR